MKLFKQKDEEIVKSEAAVVEAFIEKREMLRKIENENDWFERWRYIYNKLRPIDILLLIAIKLFFGDAPERLDND